MLPITSPHFEATSIISHNFIDNISVKEKNSNTG